jgi:hypothetical protein
MRALSRHAAPHEPPLCLPNYLPLSFADRKRVTVVPHTGQAPLAIERPLAVFSTLPCLMVRFWRHLTQ